MALNKVSKFEADMGGNEEEKPLNHAFNMKTND